MGWVWTVSRKQSFPENHIVNNLLVNREVNQVNHLDIQQD